jgi:hypothetical protein
MRLSGDFSVSGGISRKIFFSTFGVVRRMRPSNIELGVDCEKISTVEK